MKPNKTSHPALLAAAVVMATVVLGMSTVLGQAPTATTTFTGATNTAWTDATNWDSGLPDSLDNAWIGSGQTAVVTSAALDAAPFGTLTLGTNATLQLSATGKTGLPSGKTIYFNNGSYLQFTAGDINRSATYNVLSGATASFKPANSNSDTIVSGSAVGASDSVLNIDINNATFFRTRWSNASFLGTMNYTSGANSRQVDLSSFATANTAVGPGTTSFGNNVTAALGGSNRMSDSATVKFVGAAGGTNIKFNGGADRSDTIANLIIESPVANSSAYIRMRNGFLKASTNITFQGTAGTVRVDNELGGASTFKAGLDAQGASIVFSGTGDWAVTGSGQIKTNASTTITTNSNATISNYLQGTTSFKKNGNGTLTLNGPMTDFTGAINVAAGTLNITNSTGATSAISVGGSAASGTPKLAGSGTVNGAVTLKSASGGAAGILNVGDSTLAAKVGTLAMGSSLGFESDSTFEWDLGASKDANGVGGDDGVAGTDFDSVSVTGNIDVASGSIFKVVFGSTVLTELQDINNAFWNTPFGTQTWNMSAIFGKAFNSGAFTSVQTSNNVSAYGSFSITDSTLTWTAIPEPSTALGGLLLTVGLLRRRRSA